MRNAALIKLLEKARDEYLWDGKGQMGMDQTRYVCYAINMAAGGMEYSQRRIPNKLQDMVRSHLHGQLCMGSFLYFQLGSKADRFSSKTIQTYRFMMVNNMLRLLKEEKNG